MAYEGEADFEKCLREIINNTIIREDNCLTLLSNKKAVDILIHKRNPKPELFFIEVKYHKHTHGRLGFGNNKGAGFQPEILEKIDHLEYFKTNLRWILACDDNQYEGLFLFLTSEQINNFISGNKIGKKFNNIKLSIFNSSEWLSEDQLLIALKKWLGI